MYIIVHIYMHNTCKEYEGNLQWTDVKSYTLDLVPTFITMLIFYSANVQQ